MQSAWHHFWFKAIDVRQYAVLRIFFGCLFAMYLANLMPFMGIHFSRAGWLGNVHASALPNWGSWSLFNLPVGPYALIYSEVAGVLGIVSAMAMAIGWKTRFATLVTWLVLVSLWNRNPLLLDGDDAVLKVMAFYLSLSPCGDAWSIDARQDSKSPRSAIWPLRLMQFQIALIYFVSGWVKFHSTEWLDGTVLQYVLIHPQYARFNLSGMLANEIFIKLLIFFACFIRWWEILFPLLLVNRYSRRLSLLIGILFHIGLLTTMTLRGFPFVMLALYPALLSNGEFMGLVEGIVGFYIRNANKTSIL